MSRKDYKRYFDVLELSPDSSLLEIKNAYMRLKRLYSADSIVMSPIEDEFPHKKRQEILKQIEEAYTALTDLIRGEQSKSIYNEKPLTSRSGAVGEKEGSISFSGPLLKQIREERGIQLYEVALDTKIRVELLENIEFERFDALPHEVYLKGHLYNYASYLLLDPKKVADDYIKRYKDSKNKTEEE